MAKVRQLHQAILVFGIQILKQYQTADHVVYGQFRQELAAQRLKYGAAAAAEVVHVVVNKAAVQAQVDMQLRLVQFHQDKKLEFVQLGLLVVIVETCKDIAAVVVLYVH